MANSIYKILLILTALAVTSQTLELQCDFSRPKFCNGTFVQTSGDSNDEVTKVSGDHPSDQTNADILFLQILNDKLGLKEIPSNIGSFFPNLKQLVWYDGEINLIEAHHLEQFPHMTHIIFMNNKIQKLDGDLFHHNPNIQNVNFSINQITRIDPEILDYETLTVVFLYKNVCIDSATTPSGDFLRLRNEIIERCGGDSTITTTTFN